MLKNALSRLHPRNVFKRKVKIPVPKQDADLQMLDNFMLKTKVLTKIAADSSHPIQQAALSVRNRFTYATDASSSSVQCLDTIERLITENLTGLESAQSVDELSQTENVVGSTKDNLDTIVRMSFAREYFRRLRKALDGGELSAEALKAEKFKELIDITIRGTASERIEAQLKLFGPELNQERLQECFYSLYEPEVHTCTKLFLRSPLVHPHHQKKMPKFAKAYLLDKHDLNMKLRCILGWSDPNYSGFQSIDDATTMTATALMKARRDFYEDGTEVGQQFMRDYVGDRNSYYNDKAENRTTLQRGVVFIIATCLLDWLVCTI